MSKLFTYDNYVYDVWGIFARTKRRRTFPSLNHLTDEYVLEKTIHFKPFYDRCRLILGKTRLSKVHFSQVLPKPFIPHLEKKVIFSTNGNKIQLRGTPLIIPCHEYLSNSYIWSIRVITGSFSIKWHWWGVWTL